MSTLIKTIEELQKHVSVTVGLEITTLQPYLANAMAEAEVVKILGKTVYTELLTAHNANTLSTAQSALLPYAQKPLANLGVYSYVKTGAVNVSDAGVTTGTDRDQQAYQWQSNNLKESLLDNAYFGLDALLDYMLSVKADFPAWENSTAYSTNYQFVINSAVVYNQWVNIAENFRTFNALKSSIRAVEETNIKPNLGASLFTQLKAEILAQNISADNEALLLFIQPAVAYLSMARAIEFLNISINANGAFYNSLERNTNATATKTKAESANLADFAELNRANGMALLEELTQFLNANASTNTYPTYYSSSLYTNPTSQTKDIDLSGLNIFPAL